MYEEGGRTEKRGCRVVLVRMHPDCIPTYSKIKSAAFKKGFHKGCGHIITPKSNAQVDKGNQHAKETGLARSLETARWSARAACMMLRCGWGGCVEVESFARNRFS
jgi:hypothetical protein